MASSNTYISGYYFGERLCKALGLNGRAVTRIDLRVNVNDTVRVSFRAEPAPGVEVHVEELLTSDQADAVEREIASFNAGGWREYTNAQVEEHSTCLAAEGSAERLAQAVLRGDWQSALGLADLVQESWAEMKRIEAEGKS